MGCERPAYKLAAHLIAEMGGANGCNFAPTAEQMRQLENLCSSGRVQLLLADPEKVDLMVDGEAGEREEWIVFTKVQELAQINELLCKIFCEG